jgi:hypothetical protein
MMHDVDFRSQFQLQVVATGRKNMGYYFGRSLAIHQRFDGGQIVRSHYKRRLPVRVLTAVLTV